MTNFTTAGATHHASLTGREWREVVVEVEFLITNLGSRINAVAVHFRTEGNRGQRLSLTTRKQGTAMWARKQINF